MGKIILNGVDYSSPSGGGTQLTDFQKNKLAYLDNQLKFQAFSGNKSIMNSVYDLNVSEIIGRSGGGYNEFVNYFLSGATAYVTIKSRSAVSETIKIPLDELSSANELSVVETGVSTTSVQPVLICTTPYNGLLSVGIANNGYFMVGFFAQTFIDDEGEYIFSVMAQTVKIGLSTSASVANKILSSFDFVTLSLTNLSFSGNSYIDGLVKAGTLEGGYL